ncbi:MAG: hypothetical protein IPQ17_12795 [Xanthomonadales bacterium]|nr:hypothetical protein [Xanthomonadales bacterium]
MSIAEALEHELPHLMPMTAPFDGYIRSPARVSSTCLVSAARNRYSVPCAYAGHRVSVRLYPERIVIVGDQRSSPSTRGRPSATTWSATGSITCR